MKLLLDENLPHALRSMLPGHSVFTVAYMEWTGKKNGILLQLAASGGFDALITMDGYLQYQQNSLTLPLAVVVLRAASNDEDDLVPLVPALLEALQQLHPRTFVRVG